MFSSSSATTSPVIFAVAAQPAKAEKLRVLLEASGCDGAVAAVDAQSLAQRLSATPPTVIAIRDHGAKLAAAAQLCADLPAQTRPTLLALVSRRSPSAFAQALALGADDVIRTPTAPGEIACRLRSAAQLADARRAAAIHAAAGSERYALLAVGANDGLWDWDLATDRVYYSPRWRAMLFLTEAEIGDRLEDWLARVLPEDRDWLEATLDEQRHAPGAIFKIEYRIRGGDGKVRWMMCRGVAVADSAGGAARMAGSQTDITELKQAEEALRVSEERYSLAIKAANDGLWDWDIAEDRIFYSPRWKQMIGFDDADIADEPSEWLDRVQADDRIWLEAAIEGQVDRDEEPFQIEYRLLHRDGAYRWMLCHGIAIRDLDGKAVRLVGSQSDVSQRKNAEEQVLRDAFHDRVTGLPNRALFNDRLAMALRRSSGEPAPVAVMLAEINRYSSLADSLGPDGVDALVKETAHRLSGCLDGGDTLARLEGGLFGCILENAPNRDAILPRAERIQDGFTTAIPVDGRQVFVTLRLGVAFAGPDLRAEDLARDASRAMHRGAQDGRSTLAVFVTGEDEDDFDPLAMEQELRAAMARGGELELFYQPIHRFDDWSLAGFESLMRWRRADGGYISPGRFIPVAESTDLIVPLGLFALDSACRALADWRARFPAAQDLFVNVNVSGNQLKQADFVDDVRRVLEETGCPPDKIKLEITESAIIGDVDAANAVLMKLHDLGLKLALDDFGTGYSSLSYLYKFKFDAVKIDQSFVRAMQIREENALIIRMISDLARGLGCEVVAEGVETLVDVERLTKLGCTYGQGYHFAKPKDLAHTLRLIEGARPR